MKKKIECVNQLNGLGTFSVAFNYAAGIEKARYKVAAFQTFDKSNLVLAEA